MKHTKYPRTLHLPWSPGFTDDDKVIKDTSVFEGNRVIITKKMDGENTNMYSDHIHARSLDSVGGIDRSWVKLFWSGISHSIPDGWRICGENLWAEHSIHYVDLPSYFLGFSIWDQDNMCLGWDDTIEHFGILGIDSVPILYDGVYDVKVIASIEKSLDPVKDEGYVVRNAAAFSYAEFSRNIAKFVRKNHVLDTKHWRHKGSFTVNELRK